MKRLDYKRKRPGAGLLENTKRKSPLKVNKILNSWTKKTESKTEGKKKKGEPEGEWSRYGQSLNC